MGRSPGDPLFPGPQSRGDQNDQVQKSRDSFFSRFEPRRRGYGDRNAFGGGAVARPATGGAAVIMAGANPLRRECSVALCSAHLRDRPTPTVRAITAAVIGRTGLSMMRGAISRVTRPSEPVTNGRSLTSLPKSLAARVGALSFFNFDLIQRNLFSRLAFIFSKTARSCRTFLRKLLLSAFTERRGWKTS